MARSVRGLAVLAMWFVVAGSARATPLPPGGTVSGSAPGNVLSSYSGSVVVVVPFQDSEFLIQSPSGNTVGFISSAVVKTAASAGLDFVYQVNVAVGSVTGLSIGSFGNTKTDVFQTADHTVLASTNQFFPGDVPVATYSRSDATGNIIDVSFSGRGVTSEQASYLIIVQTNHPTYAFSNLDVNGANSVLSVRTLAPVPEPGTVLMWLGTFGGLTGFIGCRRFGRTRARSSRSVSES
jgi:hypothetical protein